MDELSAALRRERELLDQLRFRFIETRLLLAAREVRYLAWATSEIDQARVRAREADLMRAAHVHRLADENDLLGAGTPTLRDLAASADEPWAGILRDHHEGLCAMVSEIEVIGHRNAELARAGIHQVAERAGPSLFDEWLQSAAVFPDAPGETIVAPQPTAVDQLEPDAAEAHQLADERAFQDVITTASRLRMPALLAFLR